MTGAPTLPTQHPLLRAAQLLIQDLLSTLAFVALYAATNRIVVAVCVGIAIGLGEMGWELARRRPVHRMQWLSMFLVVAFGGATFLSGDPLFAMLKPALIYAAIAVVLLSPGWMNHYAPATARGVDLASLNRTFGFIWAALFGVIAAALIVVAFLATPENFALFVLIVPIAAKCLLTGAQYGVTRRMVRRRSMAS